MAEALPESVAYRDTPVPPDVSHLTTEDDQPVDNAFQDKQCELLTEALRVSWPQGRPFVSASDVAIFPMASDAAAIVPDVLLSTGVEPLEQCHLKENRSYYIWRFGKPPDLVIEIVSNKFGGEDSSKLQRYAELRVPYYVIYDPELHLSSRPLRIFQLTGLSYVEKVDRLFTEMGLGLTLWSGEFDGFQEQWLRWVDAEGNLLATGLERSNQERQRAEQERQRADQEQQRADQEKQRADQEKQRADQERQRADQGAAEIEKLRQKLLELGIEPDS